MNLILLDPGDFLSPTRVRLRGRRLEHVRTVLRPKPGDRLRVGRIDGPRGHAAVVALDADALELEIADLDAPPPAPLPVALVLALPRPPALRRILQSAAAMGVKDIALLHSARVEKSFWSSPALLPGAIDEQLRLGLEQARDTVLPRVQLQRRFRAFLEDELPARLASSRALIAHPDSPTGCPISPGEAITLLVGPEGGWLDAELTALRDRGVHPIGLGERPLRVETAVVALLARLSP